MNMQFPAARSGLAAIALILIASAPIRPVAAQSIDLPIRNIPQETQVWCWAAVAQQIINFSVGRRRTPPQCALVAMANGAPPGVCCNRAGRFNGNPQCERTGAFQQIQGLIAQFGGRLSNLAPPAHPRVLFDTLRRRHPIILAVRSTPFSGHVVVLKGMSYRRGVPVLHINDPLSHFTRPMPFQALLPFWQAAIVVR